MSDREIELFSGQSGQYKFTARAIVRDYNFSAYGVTSEDKTPRKLFGQEDTTQCDYPGCNEPATIQCGMIGCNHKVCETHGNCGIEDTPDSAVEICWGCGGKGWGEEGPDHE